MEESDASAISAASDSVDFDKHNIWNPMLELLFLKAALMHMVFEMENDIW